MTGDTQNSSQPPGVGPGAVARLGPKAATARPTLGGGCPDRPVQTRSPGSEPPSEGPCSPPPRMALPRVCPRLEAGATGRRHLRPGRRQRRGVGGQQERAEPAVLTDLTVRSASPTQTPLELSDGDVFMQGLGVCGRGTQPGQSPAVPGGARPAACRGHTHVPEGAGPGSSALGLVGAGHKSGGWAPAWGKPGARTREGHVCTSRPPPARSSAPRSSSNAGAASFIISLGFLFKILRVSEIIQYLSLT